MTAPREKDAKRKEQKDNNNKQQRGEGEEETGEQWREGFVRVDLLQLPKRPNSVIVFLFVSIFKL